MAGLKMNYQAKKNVDLITAKILIKLFKEIVMSSQIHAPTKYGIYNKKK